MKEGGMAEGKNGEELERTEKGCRREKKKNGNLKNGGQRGEAVKKKRGRQRGKERR